MLFSFALWAWVNDTSCRWVRTRLERVQAIDLQLATITVVFFVEAVDDETRAQYETPYHDAATGIAVEPLLVTTVE